MEDNNKYFKVALNESLKSLKTSDVPVGAVIVYNDRIIAKGHNLKEKTNNVFSHAEINAIKKANKKLDSWHLDQCDMYVTLKPCTICENIIKNSHIRNVYYLLDKPENKEEFYKTNFILVENKLSTQQKIILSDFFKDKRYKK
jgi:tRNA(adenine34) deaminase